MGGEPQIYTWIYRLLANAWFCDVDALERLFAWRFIKDIAARDGVYHLDGHWGRRRGAIGRLIVRRKRRSQTPALRRADHCGNDRVETAYPSVKVLNRASKRLWRHGGEKFIAR